MTAAELEIQEVGEILRLALQVYVMLDDADAVVELDIVLEAVTLIAAEAETDSLTVREMVELLDKVVEMLLEMQW